VISLEVDEAALPLRIRFCRKRPKQGLFGVRCWRGGKDDHGRNLYVVSRELRDELTRADLVSGLRFIPIQVSPGGRTDEFHGLLARRLPWPAAPFGTTGGPCDECGLSFPSFSVYRVFPRPEEPTHWMASPYSPGSIVVDKPTWEQLSGPLKALVGRGRQAVDGWRLGWFPDEQDLAFLPPELQGIAPADPDPPQGTR
jgi:hypothetical protein